MLHPQLVAHKIQLYACSHIEQNGQHSNASVRKRKPARSLKMGRGAIPLKYFLMELVAKFKRSVWFRVLLMSCLACDVGTLYYKEHLPALR